jgi:glycine/D-amino acid oxidase-like deaminating enzyme/nitrite reductase/ring-hydroxylating ferredoxin subunit
LALSVPGRGTPFAISRLMEPARTSDARVSVWTATTDPILAPPLLENASCDVCVVGAGIAGLSTAYLLTRSGRSVIVIDGGPIAGGETSRTTAHLSNVIDDRFQVIERYHGVAGARRAQESHAAAIDLIEEIALEEGIECGFQRADGFLFLAQSQEVELLERELEAAKRADFPGVEMLARAPLSSLTSGPCLRFPRQAQFHPLRYMTGLARAIRRGGGRLFSGTHARRIEGGPAAVVETDQGRLIHARSIVVATNTPVNNRVAVHTKQASYRTYALAAGIPRGSVPKGLYWDMGDPYHYVRLEEHGDKQPHGLLIVGGEDHKVGQEQDPARCFEALEAWMRERFPMAQTVEHRWSGQVVETIDGLAFIGPNPLDHDNVLIATGDSGMGMTHGTLAGLILTAHILGRRNPWADRFDAEWADLYHPSRKSFSAASVYLEENLNVAAQYLRDYTTGGEAASAQEVTPGSGAVIRRGFTKIAVYCDERGGLHELSAVCPHLGGIVHWNGVEKSWDCPCHGSRFDPLGKVINGPANTDLGPAEAHRRRVG